MDVLEWIMELRLLALLALVHLNHRITVIHSIISEILCPHRIVWNALNWNTLYSVHVILG